MIVSLQIEQGSNCPGNSVGEASRLKDLLEGRTPVSLRELADIAAAALTSTLLIEIGDSADREFAYEETTGFESPDAVFVTKERTGALTHSAQADASRSRYSRARKASSSRR